MKNKKKDFTQVETPAEIKAETFSTTKKDTNYAALPFGKMNYTIMLVGLGVIVLGFVFMSIDKEEFGFGFLGITLGPIVVLLGFIIELFAILKKN